MDEKMDDLLLPGFRFHPTDEELVGFYLKRKIQHRLLPIELIKQVDIYKYDPWDLPKLSPMGEKEWYFYCPRDRKYRNSARPNRVTKAGFWKATGTDKPIYSSVHGTKCIGLKKCLVFYRGRAAQGTKTDWMMHEFRLPSISEPASPKKLWDKKLHLNDSWAICRIFKKTNSMSLRTLSHSWVSPTPESPFSLSSDTISCNFSTAKFATPNIPSDEPINSAVHKSYPFIIPNGDLPTSFMFEMPGPTTKNTSDLASMLFNMSPVLIGDVTEISKSIDFAGPQWKFNGFPISSPEDIQGSIGNVDEEMGLSKNLSAAHDNTQWGNIGTNGFPFSLPSNLPDHIHAWKPNQPWDSLSYPYEMFTTYSTHKCYT